MKILKLFLWAVLFASIIAFLNNGRGAWGNMIFYLKLYDRQAEESAVRAEVKQYNINSAHFYDTAADDASGLGVIPASPLLKRRLFKDINMLKRDGLIMVFDRDHDEIKKIYFPRRDMAIAETEEVWAVALQDVNTRKPMTSVKAVEVKVRYIFKKEPFLTRGLIWVAHYVDVYPMDEDVPELNVKSVL